MSEHPNVAFIARGFDAFNAADIATLTEMMAENAVQHMGGSNELFSGDHRGRENILAMYGRIGEASGGSFRADPEQIYANDSQIVVVYHATATREGRRLDMRNAIVFAVENEKIVEITDIPDDADEQDAFWS
jgi:ketosteroid isomerase-like protein